MPNNSYQESISWLFQQFPSYQQIGSLAYKPTLDNTRRLLQLFGNPQNDLSFVHVAGSNGKGTVCSITASVLTEAGQKVGLFTSPHLKDFRERIRINGTMIPENDVSHFVEQIGELKLDFNPSFFEITFVLSLIHFRRNQCDICVIETGLGGRLDATNVISPLATAITTISLEHTAILGETIEEIAFEKAGIIKPKVPVVCGKVPIEAIEVIKGIAKKHNCICIGITAGPEIESPFEQNTRTATLLLEHLRKKGINWTNDHLHKGIQKIRTNTGYRARLEKISTDPDVYLDVSHNEEGIRATLQELNPKQLIVIYGSSADKDLAAIAPLFSEIGTIFFTTFDHPRAATVDQLKLAFSSLESSKKNYYTDPQEAFKMAKESTDKDSIILILGSFFLAEKFC